MRFAIDAHAIGRHLTGNEVYVRSLLRSFAALDHESDFVTYFSAEDARQWTAERFEARQVSPNPFVRLGVELAMKLRQDRPDLLHVQYTAPLACPVPVVVSVHDVSFLVHPEYFPTPRALQLRWTVKRTIRSAARILTGSEFSRDSIIEAYGESCARKIVVVPNAAASGLRPISRESAVAAVRSKFKVPQPFVLSVGDLQPRKNHIGLIAAFAELVRSFPQLNHHLVFAGKDTWFSPKVREAARQSGVADRIQFVGFVSDDDLLNLYNACDLFVFPSFYEGFGLPVSGGHGLRPRRGLLPHFLHPRSGRWRRHHVRSLFLRPRWCAPWRTCCAIRNCAPVWNVWDCSGLRASVGARPRSRRWKFTRKSPSTIAPRPENSCIDE